MSNSIFTYDKEKSCSYCAFSALRGEAVVCTKGSEKQSCEQFRYDVFKRKPHKTPPLPTFEKEDFSI